MIRPTRRGFVKGCLLTTAAAGVSRYSVAEEGSEPDLLFVVFLRGGMDGLNLLPPIVGEDRARYEGARPTLAVPVAGDGAALTLDSGVGLHPAAAPLLPLFEAGRLAVVRSTGMHEPTRSHFEAQDYMELGTPGSKSVASGWLHRHLLSAANLPEEIKVPVLAVGAMQPTSLLGSNETLTIDELGLFTFSTGPWLWQDPQRTSMRRLYSSGQTAVHAAGLQSMNAVDIVEAFVASDYTPGGGAQYPENEFGERLQLAAQMVKSDLGTRVVVVDVGGWDTHEQQGGGGGGFFAGLVASLSGGLAALYTDLEASDLAGRFTILTMTEFGRRVDENGDQGTDHGHAAPMLLLGENVVGGVHGEWPGLAPGQLFEGLDLEVTTDYRQVLSEVLIRRLGNPELATVFPGYRGYQSLGVVEGEDLPPILGDPVRRPSRRLGPG